MKIARYEKRLGAWLIDQVPAWGVFGVGLYFLILWWGPSFSLFLEILIAWLCSYAFFLVLMSLSLFLFKGGSLGSWLAGVRTRRADGQRIPLRHCLLKAGMEGLLPFVILNAVYMLMSHTERSVFDRLTNTLVVDIRS